MAKSAKRTTKPSSWNALKPCSVRAGHDCYFSGTSRGHIDGGAHPPLPPSVTEHPHQCPLSMPDAAIRFMLMCAIPMTCNNEGSGSGESAACAAALKQMNANLGGFFGYSLYDDCVYDEAFGSAVKQLTLTGMFTEDVSKLNARTSRSLGDNQPNGYPCPGPAMHIWLNHTSVKKALNVPANARFNNGDNGVGFNYTLTETNVLPL